MSFADSEVADVVPVPVCRLRHSQRLIGIDVVGRLALRDVLCQTNGRRSNRHGVGIGVNRQGVDDVSYNGIRAGLRFQALNDERLLAVGAAGRRTVHALHIIAGARPPRHSADVGVGSRVERSVGVEVDGLVDSAFDSHAVDGLDTDILGKLVHRCSATVGAGAATDIANDDEPTRKDAALVSVSRTRVTPVSALAALTCTL